MLASFAVTLTPTMRPMMKLRKKIRDVSSATSNFLISIHWWFRAQRPDYFSNLFDTNWLASARKPPVKFHEKKWKPYLTKESSKVTHYKVNGRGHNNRDWSSPILLGSESKIDSAEWKTEAVFARNLGSNFAPSKTTTSPVSQPCEATSTSTACSLNAVCKYWKKVDDCGWLRQIVCCVNNPLIHSENSWSRNMLGHRCGLLKKQTCSSQE